jgi:hypothetical protein
VLSKTYQANNEDERSRVMADPDTVQVVQKLNAGWRNYIRDLLTLDPNTFQLAQGTLGLQTADGSGLFRMADAVPPPSAVSYYDASTFKSRADACGLLLSALLPETNPQALRNALGAAYTAWNDWKIVNKRNTGESDADWLQRWADASGVDPGVVARAKAAYAAAANTPLIQAMTSFYSPANEQTFTGFDLQKFTLKRYTPTVENAKAAINTGGVKSINFNSAMMDASTSHIFVQGSASGFYEIFSGSAKGSFDQLNSKAANSEFVITGKMKVGTLSCGPGAWYPGGEVGRAFSGKGNANIWDSGSSAGNWESFFGQPNGSLARYVSQLVLVSDYTIDVTSKAGYSQSDYQKITAEASFGVWPFFSSSASSTNTTTYKRNGDSSLTSSFKLGEGEIQIWGVTVQQQA